MYDDKLKMDMMRLWKDTFADADEYINLVFDSYFNPDLCYTIYKNEKLISSMLCVKYRFTENKSSVKCAYQCGLATIPECRNMGLMRTLIYDANSNLFNNKFVLSFLIPADDRLRLYYKKCCYADVSFMSDYNSVFMYENNNDEIKLYDKNRGVFECVVRDRRYILNDLSEVFTTANYDDLRIKNIKSFNYIYNSLNDFYVKFKSLLNSSTFMVADYSFDDFIAICLDNYFSGGKILCLTDENNKPSSMIFCSNIGEGSATVQLQVSTSEEAEFLLLQILKNLLPEHTVINVRKYDNLVRRDEKVVSRSDAKSLSTPGLNSVLATWGNAKQSVEFRSRPYAMVKILNVLEILKFAAGLYPNSEFSILINSDTIPENEGLFLVHRGEVRCKPKNFMTGEELHTYIAECNTRTNWFMLSVPELAELLFRQESDAVAGVESVIPRLSMTVALMLE